MEETMDINKIITESISNLINEDKSGFDAAKEAITKAGGKVADTAKEAATKVATKGKEIAGDVKEVGEEAVSGIQKFSSDNPKTSAAIAAALAAGLGAVAFRKKLAALAKKGMPVVKKKTAEVAKKIAKKLES